MSDDHALDQAIDDIRHSLRYLIPERISGLSRQPESPIERQLLIGMMTLSYVTPCYHFGDEFSELTIKEGRADKPTFKVQLQAPVMDYRVDFLITVVLAGKVIGRLAVECDGLAFHERTKEQAARDRSRDRALTLAGYKVIRFTGSEIYRDVMRCVHDAHYAAWHFFVAPDAE